jgi:hypothetical protein
MRDLLGLIFPASLIEPCGGIAPRAVVALGTVPLEAVHQDEKINMLTGAIE